MEIKEYDNDLLVEFYAKNGIEIDENKKYFGSSVKSFALIEKDEIIGAVSYSIYKEKSFIEVVAVSEFHRRKGYGRMLLDIAIKEMNMPIYIISKQDNFFLNYGFKYDDADLIDKECKTCSDYNVTCFPKVMILT